MTDYTLDQVLTPLAITVIIDNKIRDPEMNAFCEWADTLLPLFNLQAPSRAALIKWFEDHEKQLKKKLEGPRKNTTILIALSCLSLIHI